jgi:XTP/dITP diphosphohydrolase
MKIVIGSSNKHKIAEIAARCADIRDIVFIPVHEIVEMGEIEENGSTFTGNALIKAQAIMKKTGLPSLADDSGLSVDVLGGEPGIYSARYGNLDSDTARNNLLLANMKGIADGKRSARFICAISLVLPDGREFTAEGRCEGSIGFDPRGDMGFGYDPIFILPDGRSMAELSMDEKNRISHRAHALDTLHECILKNLMDRR